ncbi:hypothetical protein BU24DRAFT_460754 [Aaosphaeria arxii CBS 175.79]|uniref:Lipocalin-like domain-containing protein n=1 Tax=Aaosphaeria arxii CBS 175.79 TaxID=1450172 RepID=A0A6A5XY38_9PLEO|nr:uncharacterized protein BU24DRAFT_460754 [Aaosphaeria arxii CBS 175.79]KAF2017747.1 hypothetical protein BU24DRAFT_460754 [Aaosphaeria arxii CBS 175.79]
MAAPNINYAGTWTLNRQDSDSPEPLLSLQGIGYFIRKSIALATIRLQITQHEDPPLPPNSSKEKVQHIVCSQTASGLKGTSEYHCADNQFRDHSDWLFGAVRGKAEWLELEELDEPFLKKGWDSGAQHHAFIFITVES